MGIFKKADLKTPLTVLGAFQQAFGGVPDEAECYDGFKENSFYEKEFTYPTIFHPKHGLIYWKDDDWWLVNTKSFQGRYLPMNEVTHSPAFKYKGYFKAAPQFDALLEETEKDHSDKSNFYDLMAGEDY
jgi:hypothetical protein